MKNLIFDDLFRWDANGTTVKCTGTMQKKSTLALAEKKITK